MGIALGGVVTRRNDRGEGVRNIARFNDEAGLADVEEEQQKRHDNASQENPLCDLDGNDRGNGHCANDKEGN